jgi:hypothetical protein
MQWKRPRIWTFGPAHAKRSRTWNLNEICGAEIKIRTLWRVEFCDMEFDMGAEQWARNRMTAFVLHPCNYGFFSTTETSTGQYIECRKVPDRGYLRPSSYSETSSSGKARTIILSDKLQEKIPGNKIREYLRPLSIQAADEIHSRRYIDKSDQRFIINYCWINGSGTKPT